MTRSGHNGNDLTPLLVGRRRAVPMVHLKGRKLRGAFPPVLCLKEVLHSSACTKRVFIVQGIDNSCYCVPKGHVCHQQTAIVYLHQSLYNITRQLRRPRSQEHTASTSTPRPQSVVPTTTSQRNSRSLLRYIITSSCTGCPGWYESIPTESECMQAATVMGLRFRHVWIRRNGLRHPPRCWRGGRGGVHFSNNHLCRPQRHFRRRSNGDRRSYRRDRRDRMGRRNGRRERRFGRNRRFRRNRRREVCRSAWFRKFADSVLCGAGRQYYTKSMFVGCSQSSRNHCCNLSLLPCIDMCRHTEGCVEIQAYEGSRNCNCYLFARNNCTVTRTGGHGGYNIWRPVATGPPKSTTAGVLTSPKVNETNRPRTSNSRKFILKDPGSHEDSSWKVALFASIATVVVLGIAYMIITRWHGEKTCRDEDDTNDSLELKSVVASEVQDSDTQKIVEVSSHEHIPIMNIASPEPVRADSAESPAVRRPQLIHASHSDPTALSWNLPTTPEIDRDTTVTRWAQTHNVDHSMMTPSTRHILRTRLQADAAISDPNALRRQPGFNAAPRSLGIGLDSRDVNATLAFFKALAEQVIDRKDGGYRHGTVPMQAMGRNVSGGHRRQHHGRMRSSRPETQHSARDRSSEETWKRIGRPASISGRSARARGWSRDRRGEPRKKRAVHKRTDSNEAVWGGSEADFDVSVDIVDSGGPRDTVLNTVAEAGELSQGMPLPRSVLPQRDPPSHHTRQRTSQESNSISEPSTSGASGSSTTGTMSTMSSTDTSAPTRVARKPEPQYTADEPVRFNLRRIGIPRLNLGHHSAQAIMYRTDAVTDPYFYEEHRRSGSDNSSITASSRTASEI